MTELHRDCTRKTTFVLFFLMRQKHWPSLAASGVRNRAPGRNATVRVRSPKASGSPPNHLLCKSFDPTSNSSSLFQTSHTCLWHWRVSYICLSTGKLFCFCSMLIDEALPITAEAAIGPPCRSLAARATSGLGTSASAHGSAHPISNTTPCGAHLADIKPTVLAETQVYFGDLTLKTLRKMIHRRGFLESIKRSWI